MEMQLNKDKIRYFYKQIIEYYEPQIKESYWGNENDLAELVEQSEKSSAGDDNVSITCKNGQEIKFPRLLFDFLFKGNIDCTFGHQIGQRYENGDYIFIELIESPIVAINKNIEKFGVFPITRDINEGIESCFFIKSREQGENYDYPNEIIPFFVSQMRSRLKIFRDTLPPYVIDHFEPIKYVLKIKRGQENLLIKLLYKLSNHLGVIENKSKEIGYIAVQQDINNLLDGNGNFIISNDFIEEADMLRYYISALNNPDITYQFLDLYHILEACFYKYFYSYVKNLNGSISEKDLYKRIKDYATEQMMLSLVLKECKNNFTVIYSKLRDLTNLKGFFKAIGKDINIGNWDPGKEDDFSIKLSDIIYALRNSITHSKDVESHIDQIKDDIVLKNALKEINKIMMFDINKIVLERSINKW